MREHRARREADELLLLVRQRKYFVLHAPRKTGKTSALLALRDELNAGGEFRCVYVTEGRSWDEKIFRRDEVEGGTPITVWGM